MYKNLNEYIACLEREGELLRITVPVDTVYEIAEITDRVSKSEGGGKALLFECAGGEFPVLTNLFGSDRRIAMALGVESLDELAERIDNLLKQAVGPKNTLVEKLRMLPLLAEMSRWLPRTSTSRGECQQVVLTGDQASLSVLPVLKCWPSDGGRFVTLPLVHTLDPETGLRNVGMYRMQVLDDYTTGMHWHIHKTGARHYDGYKRLGQRMPVAVALGGDPAYTYSATAPMPDNMDEYLLAGFLRRRSVKLVKCLTNDIYVPADCDFVIEGYVDPAEEKVVEGPFGDHTGFYSLEDHYPRFHVTAITHRRGAVWPATLVGVPPQEDAYIAKATERIFLAPIRLAVQPEVVDLTMPEAGTAHNLAVVSIASRYPGQAIKVAQGLWSAGQMMFNKYLILLPEEVDVRNAESWACKVREADLSRALVRSEGVLDVLDHATTTLGFGGKLALDLTGKLFYPKAECAELSYSLMGSTSPIPLNRSMVDASDASTSSRSMVDASATLFFADIPVERDGVRFDTRFFNTWGVVVAFANSGVEVAMLEGVKYLVVFDRAAEGFTAEELLWLAAANTDPRRDVQIYGVEELRRAMEARTAQCESLSLWIDARSKRPGVAGNPTRFPNVVTAKPETIALVDDRWSAYGLGAFIESPSRRYRTLLLSEGAQW